MIHVAAKYEPRARAFLSSWQSRCHVGGLAALILCLWRFCKTVALPEGLLLLLFAANFLQWAATPERAFFYYYYYPYPRMAHLETPWDCALGVVGRQEQ